MEIHHRTVSIPATQLQNKKKVFNFCCLRCGSPRPRFKINYI